MAIRYNFNEEKTINVVLYIAEKLKRRDFHKIFKILYFSDREFLNQYGVPITGDTYIAMDAGPVPTKTYDMFKIVRGDSYMQDTKNLGKFLLYQTGCLYCLCKKRTLTTSLLPKRTLSML